MSEAVKLACIMFVIASAAWISGYVCGIRRATHEGYMALLRAKVRLDDLFFEIMRRRA